MSAETVNKLCSSCLEVKPLNEFNRTDISGRLRAACKKCDYKREKIRRRLKGAAMKEEKFNSIYNGLSVQHKKVFESVPGDAYWSAARVGSDMFSKGIKLDLSIITGTLNCLVRNGLVIETEKGMFSRERVERSAKPKKEVIQAVKQVTKIEESMPKEQRSPFDIIREISLKFMDVAKTINSIAAELDASLSAAETHIAANDKDTEKLKQLQVLLKSLG